MNEPSLPQVQDTATLVITRLFDAPRDQVFLAWSEAERLAQWWGPKGFALRVCRLEMRPEGMFHYVIASPEGHQMWGRFVYRDITPPERLVFISSFSDEAASIGRHPLSPTWPLEIQNTLTLAEKDGKTTLTMVAIPVNATEAELKTFENFHESVRQGFGGTLDQLAEYLAQG